MGITRRFKKCLYCDSQVYAKGLCKYHYYKQLQKKLRDKKKKKKIVKRKTSSFGRYAYKKAREAFFSHDENRFCKVRVEGVCNVHATDIHHKAGRIGELLTNQAYFLPVCRQCHRYIHDHSKWAEENGFIIHFN